MARLGVELVTCFMSSGLMAVMLLMRDFPITVLANCTWAVMLATSTE